MTILNNYLNKLYIEAEKLNAANIISALNETKPHKNILDVGCWDGKETLKWAKAANVTDIMGIELVKEAALEAHKNGITTFSIYADKDTWPIKDNSVDCIVSNQVVEHLTNLDHYFSESYRVLKPGGFLITSTNNLSSLHNIGALLFGWTPFDLTNSSEKKLGIGNPLALHKTLQKGRGTSWLHKCIYTTRWLVDWQRLFGFNLVKSYGAGLYPFPAVFGNYVKIYSAFITIVCKKNL